MPVKSNLFKLWKEKELEIGKPIKPYEIAKQTGLHPQTVEHILMGTNSRIDLPKVAIVCKALGLRKVVVFVYEPESET